MAIKQNGIKYIIIYLKPIKRVNYEVVRESCPTPLDNFNGIHKNYKDVRRLMQEAQLHVSSTYSSVLIRSSLDNQIPSKIYICKSST